MAVSAGSLAAEQKPCMFITLVPIILRRIRWQILEKETSIKVVHDVLIPNEVLETGKLMAAAPALTSVVPIRQLPLNVSWRRVSFQPLDKSNAAKLEES